MQITFAERSNKDIDQLVQLCRTPSKQVGSDTLVIPRFDELASGYTVKDELRDADGGDNSHVDHLQIIAYRFKLPQRIIPDLTVAVDSSVLPLGQMVGGGVAFAIRGAAVCIGSGSMLVLRYNTGTLVIVAENKLQTFRHIGRRLGHPDLYVEEKDGRLKERLSAIDNTNRIQDRCRSFIERMIQEEALGVLAANNGGLLLVDGALSASYDTPVNYMRQMLATARNHGVDVCAISKRSGLSISGLSVTSLFDRYPRFVGYAPLLPIVRAERKSYGWARQRSAGTITVGTQIFAARFGFGPPGLTYRVDVSKSYGSTDDDVINTLYNKCPMYGGYPKNLIDAHQYCTFLGGEALSLLADLVARTGTKVKEDPSMSVLFQPFGAFGK